MRIDITTAMKDLITRSSFQDNDLISLLEALDLQVRDIPLKPFMETPGVKSDTNPLYRIIDRLPKKWFYDKDTIKKDILKLLEKEDDEDHLKKIHEFLIQQSKQKIHENNQSLYL